MSKNVKQLARSAFKNYLEQCGLEGGTVAGFKSHMTDNFLEELDRYQNELQQAAIGRWWNEFSKLAVTKEDDDQLDFFLGDSKLPLSVSIPTGVPGQYIQKLTKNCTLNEMASHAKLVKEHGLACFQKASLYEELILEGLDISDGDGEWTIGKVYETKLENNRLEA